MGNLWQGVLDVFERGLTLLHDLVEPIVGMHAWGWAIILLTLVIRVMLLPLAIKQTRSMRAMQALQPQMKELQKKYKVDRELLRKDPEQYKAKKQKLNEEMMALYQREGANPAASCLPLLLQAPIFIALFWTLRDSPELTGAEFYFFTAVGEGGLEQLVSASGWPGWLLILLMSGTMFWSQKQMMARNAAQMADSPMAQQQKIMLYVMPAFLAFISINFPLGVLLYWVTTNFWQVGQQFVILREVQHEVEDGTLAEHPGGEAARRNKAAGGGKGATSGTGNTKGDTKGDRSGRDRTPPAAREPRSGSGSKDAKKAKDAPKDGNKPKDRPSKQGGSRPTNRRDHLPRRADGGRS